MYLSVTLILLGEVLLTWPRGLLLYWGIWFLGANLFGRAWEEPALRRRFGTACAQYQSGVPRWVPRLRPWRSG